MPSLFARLRPAPRVSSLAYDAAVNMARQAHWYRDGAVPDTMDGRFAMLATVLALVTLRLEDAGADFNEASVSLTEAFIADMDVQMREAGFGDPSLGKQVRHLVGSLASRVDRWRRLLAGDGEWESVVARSVYRDQGVSREALDYTTGALRDFHARLAGAAPGDVGKGHW